MAQILDPSITSYLNTDIYLLVSCSEDGDVRVEKFADRLDLLSFLEDETGEATFFSTFDAIPRDPAEWRGKRLLVKGTTISPRRSKWEVD